MVDTNRDGRVDQRDTPMAVGGFINGLRPVNLAKPLLQKAGAGAAPSRTAPQARPSARPAASGPQFSNLVFASRVTRDGRPIDAAAVLPAGGKAIYATVSFQGMRNGVNWTQVWSHNEQTIVNETERWDAGASGRRTVTLKNSNGLPAGTYHLVLAVGKTIVAEGEVIVGRRELDTDTQISGQVVDGRTNRGVSGAVVLALKPGVRVRDFARQQRKDMVLTQAQSDRSGRFTFQQQLPKGQAYSLVVMHQQYKNMAIESALRIGADAPENAEINPIPLQRG